MGGTVNFTRHSTRLRSARTCYDHLAGVLGVALRDGMLRAGLVDDTPQLRFTAQGLRVLGELGVRLPQHPRRAMLRSCMDWTEKKEHLAGAGAAALLQRAIEAGWLVRTPDRVVSIDPAATAPLGRLGVDNVDRILDGILEEGA